MGGWGNIDDWRLVPAFATSVAASDQMIMRIDVSFLVYRLYTAFRDQNRSFPIRMLRFMTLIEVDIAFLIGFFEIAGIEGLKK